MKSYLVAAILLATSSAAAAQTVVSEKAYDLPTCRTPVASVMVGTLTCKAAGCQAAAAGPMGGLAQLVRMAQESQEGAYTSDFPNMADGLAAMLVTALQKTGCFNIQDRESSEQLSKEMALVGREYKPEPVDFLISGAITSISMTASHKSFGAGMIPVVGSIRSTKKLAELTVDLKIIDAVHGKVVAASSFVGDNQSSSVGIAGGGLGMGALIGVSMSNVAGTPMESVVRDVLIRSAAYASNQIIAVKTPQVLSPTAVAAPAVAGTLQAHGSASNSSH